MEIGWLLTTLSQVRVLLEEPENSKPDQSMIGLFLLHLLQTSKKRQFDLKYLAFRRSYMLAIVVAVNICQGKKCGNNQGSVDNP